MSQIDTRGLPGVSHEHNLGIRPDGGSDFFQIGGIHHGDIHTESGQMLGQQFLGSGVAQFGGHDVRSPCQEP
jgi:hypothetical protein